MATGIASLQELGVSTGSIGWKTVGFYLLTTVIAIAEGLAVTYALKPIWNSGHAPTVVIVQPSSVHFDAYATVHVQDTASHMYFNDTSANVVVFRFAGAPENTTVDALSYLYEGTVSFQMPAAVGPEGPYFGEVGPIEVYSADGDLAFAAAAESLSITSPEPYSNAISDSFQKLLFSIVPSNVIGIFYGCVEGGCTPDLLSMICFAIAFSIGMMVIRARGTAPDVLLPLFTEILDITLMLVLVVVKTTPVAVACLILSAIAANPIDALFDAMSSLGVLILGTIGAFFFHILVTMSLMSFAVTRTNPYRHIGGMGKAMTLSFGCASSAVTLPTNVICCEAMGFNPSVVRFVLSLGATVSMDGTAIYIPAAIIWLAAQAGIQMDVGQVLILAVIATLASAGASPTPGLIAIVILSWGSVFPGVPVPPEIAYLAAVDWLVDRFVTTVNITGDSFVTRMMDHILRKGTSVDVEGQKKCGVNEEGLDAAAAAMCQHSVEHAGEMLDGFIDDIATKMGSRG